MMTPSAEARELARDLLRVAAYALAMIAGLSIGHALASLL